MYEGISFTQDSWRYPAYDLALTYGVQVIDRQELFNFINNLCPELLPKLQYQQSIAKLPEICPTCQQPAIHLKGPHGMYYKCVNCKHTFNPKP